MFSNFTDHYRRLLFALLAMLLLALGQSARAADYTAGVANINGTATLWFQGASVTQSIAHYNVMHGAQQNVAMAYNSTRARHELAVPAAVGQTVNFSFTYTKAYLAYDTPWGNAVVPGAVDPGKVATPTFSLPAGSYTGTQQVTVSTATMRSSAGLLHQRRRRASLRQPAHDRGHQHYQRVCDQGLSMSNSDTASATYTIGSGDTGFTQGVTDNGSTLTIWFARSPKSDWVDIHYSLNSGGQQNVAMGYTGTRHEVTVLKPPPARRQRWLTASPT
ncbi:hypothetical protein LP420_21055 [Massilia sp. B-10]|nr:hypothetical protein LP420_21055 [Massilia sp. B-10]